MAVGELATVVKGCPRCGKRFRCADGAAGCWCEAVSLTRGALDEIRELADDCLCAGCLGEFSSRDAAAGEKRWAKARPDAHIRARGVPAVWWAGGIAFLLGAMLLGLANGPVSIGAWGILESALSHVPLIHVRSHLDSADSAIVWQLRAPRVVLAALVGGMLAVAGSAYQGVFRNPLADPYLLGVAAGAGLGATIAIAYISTSGSTPVLPIAAFAGAIVGVALAYSLGRSVGGILGTGTLLLAGVTVAAFMTAVQTFVQQEHSDTLREVYAWLLGGFAGSTWHDVVLVLPYIAVSSTVIVLHRRLLDVLSVGDEEATALGLHVRRVRFLIVVAATAGTAAAVSVSGLIGFVGIIVPHTVRLLVSTSYRAVVPLSLIVGGGFLVVADLLARTVMSPAELPIGVVTAFFGAPFFAVVLRTMRRSA
ncbi:MAG TPA: cysteine-rich CWC family protein [Gaiellaceae bacterium]|nr:cysteine-rich CWC family protein [Gaiellaceae bacterium]